jgi:hypothetical protein
MDLQRKTIQGLTSALDEKREELSAFYRQFGGKLLADSGDPDIGAGALARERIENWHSLRSSRESDTQAILDIKAAVTRQQELAKFHRELELNVTRENGLYREQLGELGKSFYERYTDADAPVFGTAWEQASREGRALIDLEDTQERLHKDLEASGFFGKMFAQFKMAGLASNIRLHKARILRIFEDGARELISKGVLEERISSGSLDAGISGLYSGIREIEGRIAVLKERSESLESDLAAVRDTLEMNKASENPSRRMDELRHRVSDTDKRIDSLVVLSAREYSDKFLDEDGVSLLGNTGDGHTFSDMGAYSHQLEQVAQLRSVISQIRRKIEVLETTIKIDAMDRNIASFERSTAECERKIQHYTEMIESLSRSIGDAREERRSLVEYRDSVQAKIVPEPPAS